MNGSKKGGKIPVHNIYYMLAYVLPQLRSRQFDGMGSEPFTNAADLCAEILIRLVSALVKRGLGRDYVEQSESLTLVKGQVQVVPTLRSRLRGSVQVQCSFDEYSVDTPFNQIVKATLQVLLRLNVDPQRKQKAKRLLAHFSGVSDVCLPDLPRQVHLQRQHSAYHFVLHMCWLTIDGLIVTRDGHTRGLDYFPQQKMHDLFEQFVRAYVRAEYPQAYVSARHVTWAHDGATGDQSLLPQMKTDIFIHFRDQILIVDTKWYKSVLSSNNQGITKLRSSHLYQICAYVTQEAATRALHNAQRNQEAPQVAGLLLYAQDAQGTSISENYTLAGHQIGAQTLNMEAGFDTIAATLDGIITRYYPELSRVSQGRFSEHQP